jgi:3-oxoadipate CoA-transferase alpha subunit
VFETPILGDVALVGGYLGDPLGNVVYRKTSRNFNPVMAAAAELSIVQVDRVVGVGELDPEAVVTSGIYVDRVVAVGDRAWLREPA